VTTRLPNFVYIGPSKAGSTWLHEVLIQHPQVYLSDAKDLYFFDRYFDRGVDWYAGYFRDAGPQHKVVGEVCQEYLSSADAPVRMRSVLGADARLMVTLRDPVTRAFSAYLYMRKHNVFEGTFREALETRPGMFQHNRYATLLERYLEHYDRSAIHCAVFDDLVQSPQRFVDDVLAWLAIDPMPLDDSMLAARLPASRARSKHLASLVKRGANWARRHRSAALIGRVKRSPRLQRALYVPLRDKPVLPPEDAAYIRAQLGPEVARLEGLVGVDLRSRWGWPA
jgi:hypothetical protein